MSGFVDRLMRRRPKALSPGAGGTAGTSSAQSVCGPVREENQDRILVNDDGAIWAVADGMGGHLDGAMAAQAVIDGIVHAHAENGSVATALEATNAKLVRRPEAGIAGSTVVSLAIDDGAYHAVWVGDSRIYRLRGSTFERLTRDHSEVAELLAAGVLSEAEARDHPRRNALTRAVGAGPTLDPDERRGAAESGDVFLLCSDGLTDVMTDDEIASCLMTDRDADTLVQAAIDRGSRDNVSVVIVEA